MLSFVLEFYCGIPLSNEDYERLDKVPRRKVRQVIFLEVRFLRYAYSKAYEDLILFSILLLSSTAKLELFDQFSTL